jgi:4-hydroxysphinganine ceramide fatty acyl 2-hydroxylase
MFSHNKWYNIFIVPIAIAIKYGTTIDWTGYNFLMMLPFLLLGIFTFSLTEYLLHRFLFHSEKHLFDNRVLRYLHFIMHGIHHMLPVDP